MNKHELDVVLDIVNNYNQQIDNELEIVKDTESKIGRLVVADIDNNKYAKGVRADHNKKIKALDTGIKDAKQKVLDTVFGDTLERLGDVKVSYENVSKLADTKSKDFETSLAQARATFIKDKIAFVLNGYGYECSHDNVDALFGFIPAPFLSGISKSDNQTETYIMEMFENIHKELKLIDITFDTYATFRFNMGRYVASIKKDDVIVEKIDIEEMLNKKLTPRGRKTYKDIHTELSESIVTNLKEAGLDSGQIRTLLNRIEV